MSKSEFRKVIVDLNKMAGYQNKKEYEAYFHQFGNRRINEIDGYSIITVAIVEEVETGKVNEVDPRCITFVTEIGT